MVGIPVNDLRRTKSRLSAVLSPAERRALTLRLLGQVLDVVSDAAMGPPVVISSDPDVLTFARTHGARVIQQSDRGLNQAVRYLQIIAEESGARSLVIVPCDLPQLTASDMRSLLAARPSGPSVVVAPDAGRHGTNALVLTPPGAITPRFGRRSCDAHISSARAAGLEVATIVRPGLARDLDSAADLEMLARPANGDRTEPGLWMTSTVKEDAG